MKSLRLTSLAELPSTQATGGGHAFARQPVLGPQRCASYWLILLLLLCPAVLSGSTLPSGFLDTDISGYLTGIAGVTFDGTGRMYAWERVIA